MDDDWVAHHCTHVETYLLAGCESIDIDSVEAALGARACSEEQGVYIADRTCRADETGKEKGHANNIQVVYGNEVEFPLCE